MPVVLLHHETSPSIALAIARSRKCLAGPILGDSGINVEIVGHPKQFLRGQAAHNGARLIFEWDGPVEHKNPPLGYKPDHLYDEHPHRGIVPVGTTKHLHLVGIDLINDSSWLTTVVKPIFCITNPGGWKKWYSSKHPEWEFHAAKEIENEIDDLVRQRPLISVVFPPECIYAGLLKDRFPSVKWPR